MENSYKQFIENFNNNKDVVKNYSFKVLYKFMNIFQNDINDNIDNSDYFLFEIQKFNENDIIDNMEKEYLNLIYICFLTEKTENKDMIKGFYLKLLSITLKNYYLKRILLNFTIFKKTFKMIIKELIKHYDDIYDFIEEIKNIINKNNQNHISDIILFLFYFLIFSLTNCKDLLIEPNYIDIIFSIPDILKLNLNVNIKDIELIINSVQNSFNYIFNKHYFTLEKINIKQYEKVKIYFIEKLSESNPLLYENFIYILGELFLNDINFSPNLLKIIENILVSNNKLLHQISLNILNNFLGNNFIDNNFLKKFINVYDVLNGFNSHLFKSLYKDLEFIIEFINENNNKEEKNIFSNPMTFFLILSKKILNNSNNRIQKFFVKTICKINITNETFIPYFLNDFLIIINNPLLYPENEINVYHLKMGLIIEKFYTDYFINYKKYIFDLLNGIGKFITNKKISIYLVKAIDNIILNVDFIENENLSFLIYIEKIMDKFMSNNSSYYYKFIYWNFICNIILKTNLSSCQNDIYNKIYCELIIYMLNNNKDNLSIELLYFGSYEKNKDNELYNSTIKKMNFHLKSIINLKNLNNKIIFLKDNNLENYPFEIQNIIYYSFFTSDIIEDYINNNILKIFSSYIDLNLKREILYNIITIFELSLIFKNYNHINDELFNDVFLNLKNILKCSKNFSVDDFELYEKVLFNYILISKKSFSDYLINEIELTSKTQELNYHLHFLHLYLFLLLSSIHYKIFKEKELLVNKSLISNINIIYEFLNSNYLILTEINKILFLKNLTLCVLLMNFLKIDYNYQINIQEIFTYYDIFNNKDLFYLIKYCQIYFEKNLNSEIDLFITFIEKTLNILNEKKENFTYINLLVFILTLLDKNKLANETYSKIIKENLKNFIVLNDNRIWLLLKISSEILIDHIKENYNLIEIYDETLIQFSKIKESRGHDSFMLQTSNLISDSPFNIKIKNLINLDEDTSKYGLYVRIGILKFYEDLINNKINNNENLIYSILNSANKIILDINNLSSLRPEMELTDKHRKKLRLGQLLLTLGLIFIKENIDFSNEKYYNIIKEISNSLSLVLQKNNLNSVDYYLYLFSILFLKHSQEFRNFLLNNLINPKSKPHFISSILMISSISIIENYNNNNQEIIKFINAIVIQCTSNICNIRGFSQYFLRKINLKYYSITNNFLSNSFLEYLNRNENIQKFFIQFDLIYEKYIFLLHNLSVDNITQNSFNEIYNEIIPIDINSYFKQLSSENILLDNQDYSKVSSNWRFIFNTKEEIEKIKIEEDFQKKYNPLSKDIYHNIPKKKFDIIIIGNYINNTPNLGGLVRTSEIFNIDGITIDKENIINDKSFLTAASSAEKWINLIYVEDVKNYIINCKKNNYLILGLEKSEKAVNVKNIKFQEKIIFVVGNEKNGIDKNIISLIDSFVYGDFFGENRSLNVHINASIIIWECINSLLNNKN